MERRLWYFDEEGNVTLNTSEAVDDRQYLKKFMEEGLVYDAEPSERFVRTGEGQRRDDRRMPRGSTGVVRTGRRRITQASGPLPKMPKWSLDDRTGAVRTTAVRDMANNKNSRYPEEACGLRRIHVVLGRRSQLNMTVDGGCSPLTEPIYRDERFRSHRNTSAARISGSIFRRGGDEDLSAVLTTNFPMANQIMTNAFAKVFIEQCSVGTGIRGSGARDQGQIDSIKVTTKGAAGTVKAQPVERGIAQDPPITYRSEVTMFGRRWQFQYKAAPYVLILPFFLSFFLFSFIPLIFSFYTSMTRWNGFEDREFVGLMNFQRLLADQLFWKTLWNSVVVFVAACAR